MKYTIKLLFCFAMNHSNSSAQLFKHLTKFEGQKNVFFSQEIWQPS